MILWSSIEDILAATLRAVLKNIQEFSKDDKNAVLYFTVVQKELLNEIRSAVHFLNKNSVQDMVNTFMSDFHRFVSSNAETELTSTFQVYFNIASGKDPNRPLHRRKAIPKKTWVGALPDSERIVFKGGLIHFPNGVSESPDCFLNKCGLVSLIFLVIQILKPALFKIIEPILNVQKTQMIRKEAAETLLKEMEYFCSAVNIPLEGPHDLNELCSKCATFYDVQVIVINSIESSKPNYRCFPSQFDLTKKRVYLLLKNRENNIDHVFAIRSIKTFFRTVEKGICFFCKRNYCARYSKHIVHRCRDKPSHCQSCFGVICRSSVEKSDCEPWHYCDQLSDAKLEPARVCSNCGFSFNYDTCFKNHKFYCSKNKYYYACFTCKQSIAMNGRSETEILQCHDCRSDKKFCLVCYQTLPENHICLVAKTEKHSVWPKISVISLCYPESQQGNCQRCFENLNKYMKTHQISYKELFQSSTYHTLMCSQHTQKSINMPNAIQIYRETENFEFVGKTFSLNNCIKLPNTLETEVIRYCETDIPISAKKRPFAKSLSHLRTQKISPCHQAFEQLLNFFIENDSTNSVYLCMSNQELLTLLDIFLTYNWQPNIVQSGRKIIKLEIPFVGVKFLNFEFYSSGDMISLIEQFGLQRSVRYFPNNYNNEETLKQNIKKPPFEAFLNFNDSALVRADKKRFYDNLPASYDVNNQFFLAITENTKTFLFIVIAFVKYCFQLQTTFSLLTNNNTKIAIHPFGGHILSLSSFAMSTLKFYFLNKYDIRSVIKSYSGMSVPVSAGEHQFVTYLCNDPNYKDEEIIHAFNSKTGQMRFGNTTVDAYGLKSRIVYHYHGCEVSRTSSYGH